MASAVCRVCLAGNIRTVKIYNVHLLEVFEKLTNLKLNIESVAGMPNSVCYACYRQLQKCHIFAEMACRSDRTIRVMLYSGIEVTPRMITKMSLATPPILSVTPVLHTSVGDLNTTNTLAKVKEEQGVVKIEEADHLSALNTFPTEVLVKIEATEFEETAFTPYEDNKVIDGSDRKLFLRNVNDVENTRSNIDSFSFCCDVCNKIESTKFQLVKHMRVHTGEKPYSCNLCSKKYVLKKNLKSHMQIHTRKKPHLCNQCDKAFDYESILKVHMRSHTGEKPHSCIRCSKLFSTKSGLTRHIRSHNGEKFFSCMTCDKAFSRKSDLEIHMRLHTGERPHLCNQCNRTFAHKGNLKKHMRVHTGEKPFSCNQCDKTFVSKHHLTLHMQYHTEETPSSYSQVDEIIEIM